MTKLIDITCEVRDNHPSRWVIAIVDGTTIENEYGRSVEKWFWLPRSQVEINDDKTVTMPEWLALEKGLI